MSTADFLVLWLSILAAMIVYRCVPIFVLKGRELSDRVSHAIGLIPAAAFAALVANDLVQPSTLVSDPRVALLPLLAAGVVAFVAIKTRSLIWCALAGMVAYGFLMYVL